MMKTRDIDSMIRQVLSDEDRAFLDTLEEPTLTEQLTSLFRGRWRWLNAMSMGIALIMFIVGVFCLVRFLSTDEVPEMLRWGAATLVCLFSISYIKLWAWLEIERNAVTREIKRLELQVAQLSARLGGQGPSASR